MCHDNVRVVLVAIINFDAGFASLTSFESVPQEFWCITCTGWKEREKE